MILRVDVGAARLYFRRERDASALPTDGPSFPWLLTPEPIQESARTPNLTGFGAWQTPNWIARIANENGQAQPLLSNALRAAAAVLDDAGAVIYDGLVAQLELGLELLLTIEG